MTPPADKWAELTPPQQCAADALRACRWKPLRRLPVSAFASSGDCVLRSGHSGRRSRKHTACGRALPRSLGVDESLPQVAWALAA